MPSAYFSFKKATELNPKHAEAQLKLASLMVLSGKKELAEDAEKRVKSTLASSPTAEALNTLAFTEPRAWERQQDAVPTSAASLEPVSGRFGFFGIAHADPSWATEISREPNNLLKNCVAKAPQSAEAALASQRRLYLVTKKFDLAEHQLRRAFELNPQFGAALKDLGMLQLQQGRNQQAEQTFKQLAALPDKAYKPLHVHCSSSSWAILTPRFGNSRCWRPPTLQTARPDRTWSAPISPPEGAQTLRKC